jgi:thymidylate synthase (FAD)
MMQLIELAGRQCHRSEDVITEDSCVPWVRKLRDEFHHMSVFEHASVSVLIQTDRGVSHELVRHRIAAYSQESTRYCDYNGKPMRFISPVAALILDGKASEEVIIDYIRARDCQMRYTAECYHTYRSIGISPQIARDGLDNSLSTNIVATFDLRQWWHVLEDRYHNKKAHPKMRITMHAVLIALKRQFPVLFEHDDYEQDVVDAINKAEDLIWQR